MSLINIKNALEARLDTLAGKLPTAWENAAFTPPADGSPYQRVNILPAPPENPVIGGGATVFYRERGLMQVTLVYPSTGGARSALGKAEVIRDWFPRGASFTDGGIVVIIDNTPSIGPGRLVDGRYLLTISIAYFSNVN